MPRTKTGWIRDAREVASFLDHTANSGKRAGPWGRSRALAHRAAGALLALIAAGCGGQSGDTGTGGGGGDTGGTTTPCGCAADADCPAGTVCDACQCVPGCATADDCPASSECCDGVCTDVAADAQSCGACGAACDPPNATPECVDGQCAIGDCDAGFLDCDGDPANGCEAAGAACTCQPGEVSECYTGPDGTLDVGLCAAGQRTCLDGASWGPCEGQVLPAEDVCNGLDDDCNGADDDSDPDGDGWTACQGDCCQDAACALSLVDPAWINPGAFEYPGNGLDDDCNPATSDGLPYPTCSTAALQTPTTWLEMVKAMDICSFTLEVPPSPIDRTWGVISAALTLADGSTDVAPADVQGGVLTEYGSVLPAYGATMAALSSGAARDESDPGFVPPKNGSDPGQSGSFSAGTMAPIPADFLGPSGGVPSGCGSCDGPACGVAYDSILVKIRVRTPTNARGFRFRSRFYTAEYPDHVCTAHDDFFVALLKSSHPDTPADGNIAVDPYGNALSVNSAALEVCGQPGCAAGSLDLVGTGMGGWNGSLLDGAATVWSDSEAAIVPGETIELRFAIWDGSDSKADSTVLLDRFRWIHMLDADLPPDP